MNLRAALFLLAAITAHADPVTVTVQAGAAGKPISRDLVGVFFEDINYAADGGLCAELVQNRSFEYSAADTERWTALTAWQLVQRDGGKGSVAVETAAPLNANNPHYAVLTVDAPGGVGLQNSGFDGIAVKAGDDFDFSVFARQLAGSGGPLTVRLESVTGALLAETALPSPGVDWKKYTASLSAKQSAPDARLVLLTAGSGRLALDMVSLFPHKTFHNRPNGLRADVAQAIADLQPKFMRFPGGCLVHGDGLENIYHWKDTIGPVEERRGQRNIWRYHQSVGLGYFEYFQFCEDIGAKPLPVVAAGVCCQNSDAYVNHKWGQGQKGLPLDQMPAYVQEVLDLVEYANGPATSAWGAKRAAAGHPEPFHLQYLGLGNEDKQTPEFRERFKMIDDALRAQHPEITVIGTVGPFPEGADYDEGWKFANEEHLAMVDEHGYKPPEWFWSHLTRFDAYDRKRSKVYLGEYAAHDFKRMCTLRAALAEAAYMTSLERNGDIVRMASYAPLLAREGHTQWNPNLIYFTNSAVMPTSSYYAQQMFSRNAGDVYLPSVVSDPALAVSAVRDSRSGDLILKLVNNGAARPLHINLSGAGNVAPNAAVTVLADNDPMALHPVPQTSTLAVGPEFDCDSPANSLTVIRLKSR